MPEEPLSFLDAPRIVVPPPGPASRAWLATQAALETDAVSYAKYFPIGIRSARGATIEDVDGNRFLDWIAGISVLNLGHRHPKLVAAAERQLAAVWHALELPTEARIEFLERLSAVLPGGLRGRSRIFFTVTGGDAIETAISLADRATGRRGTVAFSGAYHGVHGGAIGVTSARKYRSTSSFSGGAVVRVPFPDPYRPIWGGDDPTSGTIAYLEHVVQDPSSGFDAPSAVLVEPILGEGGYIVPPDDFLPALREFCDRHAMLLIVDEVQTGLGRTGRMWAVEHSGVTPDILCTAKTLGGGFPLSAVVYRADLVEKLPAGFHIGTYRANPVALAVGAEVLRILAEGDIIARTAARGPKVVARFRELAARHPSIGDVRGKGFMIGLEFVHDVHGKLPWPERAHALRAELFRRGLLMHTCGAYDQTLRFMAPLVIEDALLERGLDVFAEALSALDDAGGDRRAVPPVAAPFGRPSGPDAARDPRFPTPFSPDAGPTTPTPKLDGTL